jgi:transcriptional regulator with XRE-family HTH domain
MTPSYHDELSVTSLFGHAVRTLRSQRCQSATALAKALAMSPQYLCQIEYGDRPLPSFQWVLRLAEILDLTDEQVIGLLLLATRHRKGLRLHIDDFRHHLPLLKQLVEAFPEEVPSENRHG